MLDPDNTFGTITAYCDGEGCGNEEMIDGFDGHVDFIGAVKELKSQGWMIRKTNEWQHFCSTCVESKNYE